TLPCHIPRSILSSLLLFSHPFYPSFFSSPIHSILPSSLLPSILSFLLLFSHPFYPSFFSSPIHSILPSSLLPSILSFLLLFLPATKRLWAASVLFLTF